MPRTHMELPVTGSEVSMRRRIVEIEDELIYTIDCSSPRTINVDAELITNKLRLIKNIAHNLNEDHLYTVTYDRISMKMQEKFIS